MVSWTSHTFTSLRLYPNFRLVWLGSVTEHWGEWMELAAFMWLARELTPSPFMVSLVGFSRFIPRMVAPLVGGVIADRADRRRLLLAALAAAGAASLTLSLLVYLGAVQVWHLIIIGLFNGILIGFNHPARMSIVPNLVRREHLMNAISLDHLSVMGTAVLAGPLVGLIIEEAGVGPVFLLRALGVGLAIFWLLLATVPPTPPTPMGERPLESLNRARHYVRANSVVMTLVLLYFLPNLTYTVYLNLLPIFAVDVLGVSGAGYGWLTTAWGLGALGALMVLASLGDYRHKGALLLVMGVGTGVALMAFAASPWFTLSLALLVLFGAARTVNMALLTTTVQELITDGYRGRVNSFREVVGGSSPVLGLVVGVMAEYTGAPLATGMVGVMVLAGPLAVLLALPQIRRLK